MSEFCDSEHAEFCADMAIVCRINKRHRNCKILQILICNIALSLALTAATASAEHLGVKVKKKIKNSTKNLKKKHGNAHGTKLQTK